MPAPSRYTEKQKRVWNKLEKHLGKNPSVKRPEAVATTIVDKKIAAQMAKKRMTEEQENATT